MGVMSERHQKVLELYDKMLLNNSLDKENWFNLGLSFFKLGVYDKAIECYEKSLNPSALNIEIWYNIGLAYLELGEHQKAIEFFEKVVEIHPQGKKAWHGMILTFIRLHDYERLKKCRRVMKALEVKLENSVKAILKKILMAEPGIRSVFLTDSTGQIISHLSKSSLTSKLNLEEFGATSTAIFYAMKKMGHLVDWKYQGIIRAEFDEAKIYYCPAASNKVLTIIGDKDVCMGLIRLILKSAGTELDKIFLEIFNNDPFKE